MPGRSPRASPATEALADAARLVGYELASLYTSGRKSAGLTGSVGVAVGDGVLVTVGVAVCVGIAVAGGVLAENAHPSDDRPF